ncbi:MAG: cation transporter [Nitrospirae bacterium]|nr:cation transporter [Nitrospirota bacterium]
MEHHHHPRLENHDPDSDEAACKPREQVSTRLLWIVGISAAMMVVEIVGGLLSNSLALLSDGFHMFTHVGSILISYIGILVATRRESENQTFGYWRAEILSALFNGVTLLPIVGYIVYESIQRFRHPDVAHVNAKVSLAIGAAGLAVNLVGALLLHHKHEGDLNARSAFLHLLGDMFSSVGVVVAAIMIMFTGWDLLDPLMSLAIGFMILLWSGRLIRECVGILLESVPKGIRVPDVREAILNVGAVREVHDLHIWQITSGMPMLTCHVVVDDMPLAQSESVVKDIHTLLDRRYAISHSNIQVESVAATPPPTG